MACLRYASVQLLRKCYGAYEMVLLKHLSGVLGLGSPCAAPDGCSTSYSESCWYYHQARDIYTTQHRAPRSCQESPPPSMDCAAKLISERYSGSTTRKRSRMAMTGDSDIGGWDEDDRFYPLRKWEQVEKKVNELSGCLTIEHISAAFNVLKRLKRRPPDPFLDSLTEKALVLLPDMHSWNFSSIIHACAMLEYINSAFLDAMVEEVLKPPKLSGFTPLQIACCIYSTGVLFSATKNHSGRKSKIGKMHLEGARTHAPFQSHKALVDSLAGFLIHLGEEAYFTTGRIAAMFYGLALSKHRHVALLNLLASEVARKERMEACSEQEVAMIVYSVGLLQFGHPILLKSLRDYLSKPEMLREFSVQGLNNVLYGIAISGERVPLSVLRTIAWEICRPHRVKSFSTQHLSIIIYSLGTLRIKNPRVYNVFFREIADPGRCKSDPMTLQGYVAIMSGIGRANIVVDGVARVAEALTSGGNPRRLTNQGLANTIMNLGRIAGQFDFDMPRGMLEEVCSPERLASYLEQHLVNILYGFVVTGMFQRLDRKLVDAVVEEACSVKRIPSYTHQGLANVVFAIARMRVNKLEYHDTLGENVIQRLHAFTHNGLAMIIYGWGKVGYSNEKVVSMCLKEVTREVRLLGFTEQGLSNVVFGLLRMGCREKELLRKLIEEIQRRVLPKFKYQTPPELIVELLQANIVDKSTQDMLVNMLKAIVVRFKREHRSVENLPVWAGGGTQR